MKVRLLQATPRDIVINAIRTCWQSFDKSDSFGESDLKLLRNIIRKGHTSTLEHCNYVFFIEGITRACLQEVARHRVGVSLSVESTRYTLKKILNGEMDIEDVMVPTPNMKLNALIYEHMHKLCELIEEEGLTNDVAKYGICENYPVCLQMTFNVRSLRHFIALRGSKAAHFEIRELANQFLAAIPSDHAPFFQDLIDKVE